MVGGREGRRGEREGGKEGGRREGGKEEESREGEKEVGNKEGGREEGKREREGWMERYTTKYLERVIPLYKNTHCVTD